MARLVVLLLVLLLKGALAGDYGAVVLYDHSEVRFFPDGRKVWKEETAVKILGRKGIKDFGEITIPFSTEHQRVKILYAYTVLPDGRVVKPEKKAFNIVYPPFSSEAPIYSDLKYQTISMPAVKEGAIVKYAFTLETFKPYMKNEFWATNFFQDEYPVKEAVFKAYIPKGKHYRFKTYNIAPERATPKVTHAKGYTVLTWRLTDIPPIKKEQHMPPMGEVAKRVTITSLRTWNQVAKWYAELAKDAVTPSESVKRLAQRIAGDKETLEEKVRAVYTFVSKNIRYVGMEFGINGYKPHSADTVLKNRYGDCKDHATLLIAMLKSLGVECYPVLIPTQSKANLDPDLPLPTAFNHEIAVARLNHRFLFMDTTSDYVPYGHIPSEDQGRRVLVVDINAQRGTVVETPVALPEENLEGFDGEFSLSSSGKLSGTIRFTYTGVYSEYKRAQFLNMNPSLVKSHIEKLASDISPGFEVKDYRITGVKELNTSRVTVELKGADEGYGTVTQHYLIARMPVPEYGKLSAIVAPKDRVYPYIIGYRMAKKTHVKLNLPKSFRLYLKPENFYFQNEVGSFSVVWSFSGSVVEMGSELVLRKHRVSPKEYSQLRRLFNTAVKTLRNQSIILRRKGVGSWN